ncbi:MAG: AMP-binding protein [Pseudomonadota bacterium]
MNPAEWLQRAARRWPDTPALLRGTECLADYAAFAQRAASLAAMFRYHYGIVGGDRVAIFMPNDPSYLEALYATWHAGAAVVPINAKLHAREAAWILADSGTRLVIANAPLVAALDPHLPDSVEAVIEPGGAAWEAAAERSAASETGPARMTDRSLVWLFYTSGTTGRPKGVMITAGNIAAMTACYFMDVDEVRRDDTALYAAPMSHGAGLYNFMHVIRGARHSVPPSGGFDAAEILDLAPRLGSVHMFAAPTMLRRLTDAARSAGSNGEGIRTIVYGGGPMYLADVEDAVRVLGPRFVQIYGQGESPMTITALARDLVSDRQHPRWRQRLGSVGTPQSLVSLRIADTAGEDVAPGETGEILVAGPTVMAGYWQNPMATAETIRDGWLHTGDLGRLDEDGLLTLIDRSKDVIISGGTNIYPREVEEALLEHPAVHETAVIGRAHDDWGEEVVAFVVPAPGVEIAEADLDAHCRDCIARFKRPKAYFLCDDLPKNNYGKVLKTALRERLGSQEP